MKNIILKILYILFGICFLIYLAFPSPGFPKPLWDFKESSQPADLEDPLRRGYYTNTTRDQLMSHYKNEFGWGINLNYPPEESQSIIRDQTKSSFLEEVVHPMKESIYVNGYRPTPDKEVLEVEGVRYEGKVIIKYVKSNLWLRLLAGVMTIGSIWLLITEYQKTIKNA